MTGSPTVTDAVTLEASWRVVQMVKKLVGPSVQVCRWRSQRRGVAAIRKRAMGPCADSR